MKFSFKIQVNTLQTKQMWNIEIQIISRHDIQTWIHLHQNFRTYSYIPQREIQSIQYTDIFWR